MKDSNIKEKVNKLLRELSGIESVNISDNLQDDLGLDSLSLVALLLELEDAFDIILNEVDMNPLDLITVEDVIYLAEKYHE